MTDLYVNFTKTRVGNSRTRGNSFFMGLSFSVLRRLLFVIVALVLEASEANPIAVITPGGEPSTMNTIMVGRVAFITEKQSPLGVTTATHRARASIFGHF